MKTSVLIGICDKNEKNIIINEMGQKMDAAIDVADDGIRFCLKAIRQKPDVIITDDMFLGEYYNVTLKKIAEQCRYSSMVLITSMQDRTIEKSNEELADVFLTRPLRGREFIPNILVNISQKKKLKEIETNIKHIENEFMSSKYMSFALYYIMDNFSLNQNEAENYLNKLKENTGYETDEIAKIIFDLFAAKK